jgi:rod shape-determining protein MreC
MRDFFLKYRLVIVWGAALLLTLFIYSLSIRHKEQASLPERVLLTLFSPLTRVVTAADRLVGGIWSDYVDLVGVRAENRQLREAVKELNTREVGNREALLAAGRLRELLGLRQQLKAPSLAATIIGADATPWFATLLIDRGQQDGLREGMPVVAPDGVVGQVVKVADTTARVLLVTDPASAVAGVVQRTRARGVVKGKGRGYCSLEFSLSNEEVTVGDIVVTSGVGGLFPKGLPLGEVTMVRKGNYGIFQTVDIRPTVNLSRLEEVLVLLKHAP